MNKEIVIIRNLDDIEKVDKLTVKRGMESPLLNLKGLYRIYPQFAYSFEKGDILFAIFEDKLQISIESACNFFEIEQFYFDDIDNDEFQCYWFNAKTGDIVCALDKDGNMRIIGNVIYDSLSSDNSE